MGVMKLTLDKAPPESQKTLYNYFHQLVFPAVNCVKLAELPFKRYAFSCREN